MMEDYRINKYIALCTGCSRRDAETFVVEGQVRVNGKVVKELNTKVLLSDKVTLKGKPITPPSFDYYIFYKPAGYITTREDEKGRKTIYDLIPEKLHHLKPVGRLDKDSAGLILMTNDGELINKMTHPKFHIARKYKVTMKGRFTMESVESFSRGMDIGEKGLAYAEIVSFEKQPSGFTDIIMILHQGYNRQIRRMIEVLKGEVISLKRISMGPITLKTLKRGQFSELKKREVQMLQNYIDTKAKKQKISDDK